MGMTEELPLLESPTVSQLTLHVVHGFRGTSYYLEEFKIPKAYSKAGQCNWHCFSAFHLNGQIMTVEHANEYLINQASDRYS